MGVGNLKQGLGPALVSGIELGVGKLEIGFGVWNRVWGWGLKNPGLGDQGFRVFIFTVWVVGFGVYGRFRIQV